MIIPLTMKEEETRRAGREGKIQVELHEGVQINVLVVVQLDMVGQSCPLLISVYTVF